MPGEISRSYEGPAGPEWDAARQAMDAFVAASRPTEPITGDWLASVGIYPGDEPEGEYAVRIVGGTDDGWKEDSGADRPGDEIANLVVVPDPAGWASCYVETYRLPDLNTAAIVELGVRHTRAEILDLCRALKAWAIHYPEPVQ